MLVTVEDGRATRIAGDPDHPFTNGFLCTKVSKYLERTYHPDRLLHPQIRTGAKGKGEFRRATWDEALTLIANRLQLIIDSPDGPQAILPYSYAGTMGIVQGEGLAMRFFNRIGASQLERTICSAAGAEALTATYGTRMGTDPETIGAAKLIFSGARTRSPRIRISGRSFAKRKRTARRRSASIPCARAPPTHATSIFPFVPEPMPRSRWR